MNAPCGCVETYPQLQPGRVNHGPGCVHCEVTDAEIRVLRDESRAVGDIETSRACSAALGLPTGDGAGGRLDPRVARARISARIRGVYLSEEAIVAADPNLAEIQRLDGELAKARIDRDLYREMHQSAESAVIRLHALVEELRAGCAATLSERDAAHAEIKRLRGVLAGFGGVAL